MSDCGWGGAGSVAALTIEHRFRVEVIEGVFLVLKLKYMLQVEK